MTTNRFVAVLVLAATRTAAADDTVARDAYRRAEELANANPPRWAEACPLYQASYRADPQIGVLLHLADCHEHVGRFASAWAEFNDAAELARNRQDSREAVAHARAEALVPKLSKLLVTAPPSIVPGLVVKRDGIDVTVLVGKEMPVDPGEREITAAAPGYVTWTHRVTIAGPGVTTLPVPALDKAPEPPPSTHQGTLTITTQPDAEIWIDAQRVGSHGRYTGTLRSGGHTLRVSAPDMRTYQTEVTVGDNQSRTIDIPLERVIVGGPVEELPSFELAANLAPGIKLRHDNPAVVALRVEAALRLGRHVNFGVYGEYGRIETSNACGTDITGPTPTTPFDVGPRHQFTKCAYLMPGLQLYVDVLPKRRIDPYFGLVPGFRFGGVDFRSSFANGMPIAEHRRQLAIVAAFRAGVGVHVPADPRWTIGGYVEASITVIGDGEEVEDQKGVPSYLTMFAGARGTMVF